MTIVLGLGNPGAGYLSTRHNLGFRVVDALASRAGDGGVFRIDREVRAWTADRELAGRPVVLAKPRTYMNRSGSAALRLLRRFELTPKELLVIYDDADLELGRIRVRPGGSAGGHRGVSSLIATLGTGEFPRVKLGVRGAGRDGVELADYVLEEFEDGERALAASLVELGADAVESVLRVGLPETMNLFNNRAVVDGSSDGSSEE